MTGWQAHKIEEANNENPADQGDNLLFTDDHPLPFLGEITAGLDIDLSQISGNADFVNVTVSQLVDCQNAGVVIGSDSSPTNGNVFSTINFNNITQGYILNSSNYVKGETCFEVCLEVVGGGCSLEKCGVFRIQDNCPFCYTAGSEPSFKIAPNPVTDYLYLSASDESLSLSIIDMSGRMIYNGPFTKVVDMSSWNTGFYFARYYDNKGERKVEKFYKH